MMKHINTILLVLLTIGLGINFYFDFQRAKNEKGDEVNISPAKEVSPFDNLPNDPYYDQSVHDAGPNTSIKFERLEHDFGKIKEGVMSRTAFVFTNTGDAPLLISSAIGSCGCTVPEWPKEPIKPGEKGEIKVEFDSKDKLGEQLKTVTVSSNTNPMNNVLTVKCNVLPKN
jgi:hypothetical protein